jgi:hypothetical protein
MSRELYKVVLTKSVLDRCASSGVTAADRASYRCAGPRTSALLANRWVGYGVSLRIPIQRRDPHAVRHPPRGEVRCQYATRSGDRVVTTLSAADAATVARGSPVRSFRWHRGAKHYPGWFWSVTVGDLVGYESLLERDRLWLADFDPAVFAIASKPFGLIGPDGARIRRHVPDFLLLRRDGSVVVVDVKPAGLTEVPAAAEVLDWVGRVVASRGWRYEVWSGCDPVLLANVKFLGQGRRWSLIEPTALSALHAVGVVGMTLQQAQSASLCGSGPRPPEVRAAMLALLWHHVWAVDLERPLGGSSVLTEVREIPHV